MKKRIAATLLLLAMLFGVMAPFTAFAGDVEENRYVAEGVYIRNVNKAIGKIEIEYSKDDSYDLEKRKLYQQNLKDYLSKVSKVEVKRGGETFTFDTKANDSFNLEKGQFYVSTSNVTFVFSAEKGDLITITAEGYPTKTLRISKEAGPSSVYSFTIEEQPPASKVTVSFDPGEGTGSMDAVEVEKDADYELPSCTFIAPKGKEFDGWKVGDKIKKVGEKIKVSEAITITAQWKEKESQELKEPIMPAENAFTADESSYSIGYKKNDEIKSYLEKVTAVKVMKKDGTIKEYKKDATGGIIVSPNTVQPNITFLDKDLDLSVEDKVEIIAEGYKSLNLTIAEKVSYYGFIFSFKKTNESFEEVEAAKAKLKTYVESIVEAVLEMPGIETTSNQAAIAEFKAHHKKADELLKKDNAEITPDELNSMKKMPSYMEGGKKIKGTFSEIVKKMRADFEVLGARTEKNKDNGNTYPVLNQGKIQIKSQIPELTNEKNAKQRLYLNYITQADYDAKGKADATGGATPKYKKQEVPVDDYTVKENNGVYTITVKKIPEGAVILKPVVKVYLAEITFVENGDMVYVKKSVTPTPSVPYTPSVPSTPAPKMPTKLEDTEQGKRYTAEGTPEALNGAVKLDVVIDEQGRTHWNFLDKDGNKVKTKGAVKVTMPMKEGLRAPYRIKVNGVYTTFEEQNGSFSTVLRPMADVEMVRLNDTVDGRQGILEGTKEALNGAVSMKLEKKSNGAFVFRLYDAQGKEVKSNGYVFVELPVPAGTKAPYRLSVGGVKTTFEETNHGTLAFAVLIQ